jgi:hypothetical protein
VSPAIARLRHALDVAERHGWDVSSLHDGYASITTRARVEITILGDSLPAGVVATEVTEWRPARGYSDAEYRTERAVVDGVLVIATASRLVSR